MQKKPWTPPTVTEHGNVVTQTKGFGGDTWEPLMPKPGEPDEPNPVLPPA